jgi:hypothetical protein
MRKAMLAILLMAASVRASEQKEQGPKPWELSLEQRIQKRIDRAAREARIAAFDHETGQVSPREAIDVVVGTRNPEAFLPYELFEALATEIEARARGERPLTRNEQVPAFGFDEIAFWSDLESICARYLEVRARDAELPELAAKASPAEVPLLHNEMNGMARRICTERAAALEAVRAHFGVFEFDHFLYAVIAPRCVRATSSTAPIEEYERDLRVAARGCR